MTLLDKAFEFLYNIDNATLCGCVDQDEMEFSIGEETMVVMFNSTTLTTTYSVADYDVQDLIEEEVILELSEVHFFDEYNNEVEMLIKLDSVHLDRLTHLILTK